MGAEPANKQGASVYTEALLAKMKKPVTDQKKFLEKDVLSTYYRTRDVDNGWWGGGRRKNEKHPNMQKKNPASQSNMI